MACDGPAADALKMGMRWPFCMSQQTKQPESGSLDSRRFALPITLARHWMHSEMWWPRLLRHHSEIAWDDYEKDYSDLPEQVLQHHRQGGFGVAGGQ